ncbi:MAG: BspA family leucine-rich repeat surface protein, partial [Enterococcus faecalis]|nr:BspA family leucine-rich repeat surface protein [Enterococcus faecalis]MDU7646787.1 BspA family leucine-rich repeat surface protein [Enterococcus faecalis]
MKKRVVMTIAGIMGGTFTSSAVALAQTKTSVEERGPVQESTISIPDSEILAEEKEVAATIESTTTTSTIKTTSDSLEKALEATTSETSSTESGSASQSSASQHRKEIETEETSLKAQTTSTVLTGMIGTSQWSLDPTSGELTIGPGVFSDDVSSAFDSISNVKKVTFSGPVKAGKSLKSLFSSWFALLSIERLDYLDTSQVTDMSYMFTNCTGLQTLDVSNFDTSQVTNMSMMFYNCRGLQTLDVSNFETSQVTDMSYMFDACSGLQTLDVSNFETSQVTDMSSMFDACSGLQTLDVSNFDTSQVTNMRGMFFLCTGLQTLDVSNFDTSQVTDMNNMFAGCKALQTLDLSNFNTNQVTDMAGMFSSCDKIQTVNVSNFDTSQVTNMRGMFSHCWELQALDVTKFDTSQVTNMSSMFYGCSGLQTLDVSNFDTSQVTSMGGMFIGCRGLQTLDVSNFDTSQVINMSSMFADCRGLQTLDITNFDTSQVTNMSNMFDGCSGLQTLDVSKFDTSKVTGMIYMFRDCSGLQTLDVTKFNTSQVTYMWNMFSGCSGLQTLDLSNFDTSQVTNTDEMFDNCDALKKITLGAKSIFGTKTNTNLPSIADTSLYTGRWIGVNTSNTYSDSNTFMSNYDGSVPDTYVWEKASVLNSTLDPSSVRVHSESEVEWTWKITNSSSKSAENVYSDITLPEGLKIDKNSVKKNNLPVSVDDINGMNNLGTLSSNETVTFTFKTIVSGKPDKWLELMGKVTWEDNGIRTVNSSNKVKIIDEEQKDKGNQTNDLELLSVPVGFRYGILNKSNTPQTIHLNARNYQTHTNVVTDGFYTRLRDDRTKDNGWKLTAQLSDFSDETNSTVLTNSGIALKMENMKIESIKNRDTPQESIDQNPTGTPSTVSTNETLISGQAAKTLINAQANEGHGTWQLRIPFDKVSLTVPANTGEINKNYTATLT